MYAHVAQLSSSDKARMDCKPIMFCDGSELHATIPRESIAGKACMSADAVRRARDCHQEPANWTE